MTKWHCVVDVRNCWHMHRMTSKQHSVSTNSPQWLQFKVGLLIIKLSKHAMVPSPKCYGPSLWITKLTLNEPATKGNISNIIITQNMHVNCIPFSFRGSTRWLAWEKCPEFKNSHSMVQAQLLPYPTTNLFQSNCVHKQQLENTGVQKR